jgi:hypothetical protein
LLLDLPFCFLYAARALSACSGEATGRAASSR